MNESDTSAPTVFHVATPTAAPTPSVGDMNDPSNPYYLLEYLGLPVEAHSAFLAVQLLLMAFFSNSIHLAKGNDQGGALNVRTNLIVTACWAGVLLNYFTLNKYLFVTMPCWMYVEVAFISPALIMLPYFVLGLEVLVQQVHAAMDAHQPTRLAFVHRLFKEPDRIRYFSTLIIVLGTLIQGGIGALALWLRFRERELDVLSGACVLGSELTYMAIIFLVYVVLGFGVFVMVGFNAIDEHWLIIVEIRCFMCHNLITLTAFLIINISEDLYARVNPVFPVEFLAMLFSASPVLYSMVGTRFYLWITAWRASRNQARLAAMAKGMQHGAREMITQVVKSTGRMNPTNDGGYQSLPKKAGGSAEVASEDSEVSEVEEYELSTFVPGDSDGDTKTGGHVKIPVRPVSSQPKFTAKPKAKARDNGFQQRLANIPAKVKIAEFVHQDAATVQVINRGHQSVRGHLNYCGLFIFEAEQILSGRYEEINPLVHLCICLREAFEARRDANGVSAKGGKGGAGGSKGGAGLADFDNDRLYEALRAAATAGFKLGHPDLEKGMGGKLKIESKTLTAPILCHLYALATELLGQQLLLLSNSDLNNYINIILTTE